MNAATEGGRCEAAQVADPRGCEGRPDAVRIVDQTGASTKACLRHGAVLLASLHHGRVYPLHGPHGSAIVVYTRARQLPPFGFLTGPGADHVYTTDEAAVLPYAPEPPLPGTHTSALGRRFEAGTAPGRSVSSRHSVHSLRLDASGTGSAAAGNSDGNGWSGPGNAGSSRWTERCLSRLRGTAG